MDSLYAAQKCWLWGARVRNALLLWLPAASGEMILSLAYWYVISDFLYVYFFPWLIGKLQKIAISFNFDQHLKGYFDLAY